MEAPETVHSALESAEEALLRGQFAQAEACATLALRMCQLGEPAGVNIKDRAAVVLVQALYETARFGSAQHALQDCVGGGMEAWPPTTLLLWLSLALDTDHKNDAQARILRLLQRKAPGAEGGWPARQYLALLHLYLFEVLLPELREPGAVLRWLSDTQLPISKDDRQLMSRELRALMPGGTAGAPASPGTAAAARRRASGVRSVMVPPPPSARALALDGDASEEGDAAEPDISEALRQAEEAEAAALEDDASSGGPAYPSAGHPGEEEGGARAKATAALDWLGACQHRVLSGLAAAAAAVSRVAWAPPSSPAALPAARRPPAASAVARGGSSPEGRGGGGALAMLPGGAHPAVVGSLLGLALYAAYAERRSLRRVLARARRGTLDRLLHVARMAATLRPNPMAF